MKLLRVLFCPSPKRLSFLSKVDCFKCIFSWMWDRLDLVFPPYTMVKLINNILQICPGAVFPGTPADSTVNALRPDTARTQKYDDFLLNANALNGEVTLIPGVGTTYGERLNDDGRQTVSVLHTF